MSLTLDPIFSKSMVLQRGMPVPIWGTAEPGQPVTVSVQGAQASATADDAGSWRCVLPELAASDAETLVAEGPDGRIEVSDVAVGEVFVAGGQSNMELWMRYECHLAEVVPTCENPRIRFYDMPKCSYPGQLDDFDYSEAGFWRKATASDLERFSAAGYFFARELEAALDVPVGIEGCNYGGTKSSAWMSEANARRVQRPQVEVFERSLQGLSCDELLAHGRLNPRNDKGYATWPAWNEFFLTATRTAEEAAVFFEREARAAAAMATPAGSERSADADPLASHPGILTPTKDAPGALFEHMVLPLAPFAVRGVLWYQGESDDEDPGAQVCHRDALACIIDDWRAAWEDPGLPFLVVQLPGFRVWRGMDLDADDWVTIRAAQQEVADAVDGVWLCSIGDAGEEMDIHPKDKLVVGHRLALLALRHLFGRDVLADAPRLTGVAREGGAIRLRFSHADGLAVKGDEVSALEVLAGGASLPFTSRVQGSELVVVPDAEQEGSVTVRLGWQNWHIINLVNAAGIPALPFEVEIG